MRPISDLPGCILNSYTEMNFKIEANFLLTSLEPTVYYNLTSALQNCHENKDCKGVSRLNDQYQVSKSFDLVSDSEGSSFVKRSGDCFHSSELYTGIANTTVSGQSCIKWSSVKLEKLHELGVFSTLENNFCRDPFGTKKAPWCIISNFDWEYCDLPRCILATENILSTTLPFEQSFNTHTCSSPCSKSDKVTCDNGAAICPKIWSTLNLATEFSNKGCNKPCGNGKIKYTRECFYPGGCDGIELEELREECNTHPCKECYFGSGIDYTGTKIKQWDGSKCVNWKSYLKNEDVFYTRYQNYKWFEFENKILSSAKNWNHNHCRNPNVQNFTAPACLNEEGYLQYCDVAHCEDLIHTVAGHGYQTSQTHLMAE